MDQFDLLFNNVFNSDDTDTSQDYVFDVTSPPDSESDDTSELTDIDFSSQDINDKDTALFNQLTSLFRSKRLYKDGVNVFQRVYLESMPVAYQICAYLRMIGNHAHKPTFKRFILEEKICCLDTLNEYLNFMEHINLIKQTRHSISITTSTLKYFNKNKATKVQSNVSSNLQSMFKTSSRILAIRLRIDGNSLFRKPALTSRYIYEVNPRTWILGGIEGESINSLVGRLRTISSDISVLEKATIKVYIHKLALTDEQFNLIESSDFIFQEIGKRDLRFDIVKYE